MVSPVPYAESGSGSTGYVGLCARGTTSESQNPQSRQRWVSKGALRLGFPAHDHPSKLKPNLLRTPVRTARGIPPSLRVTSRTKDENQDQNEPKPKNIDVADVTSSLRL